jgi:hypothetical protein
VGKGLPHWGGFGLGAVQAEASGFFLGALDVAEGLTDGVAALKKGDPFHDLAGTGGGDSHDGFLGFYLQNVLIAFDRVARAEIKGHDGCFSDGLAQLGHDDGDAGHKT